MKQQPQASISLEKAAGQLGLTQEELTVICEKDTGQKYHHRTIFTNRIRFFKKELRRIRGMLDRGNVPLLNT